MYDERVANTKRDYRFFLAGIVIFIIGLILFFIIGLLGWPGNLDPVVAQNAYYCETIDYFGFYRQISNTWSNLFIIIPGLIILIQIGKVKPTTDTKELDNDLIRPTILSITWGIIPIIIGISSMFFHASLTVWGNFLDIFSMNLLISFLICFDLSRVLRWSQRQFISILISINIVLGLLLYFNLELNVFLFTMLVFIAVFLDISILIAIKIRKSFRWFYRDWRWFALGLSIWIGITFVWLTSNTGGPLCFPNSVISGHTIWHLGDGLCIYIFYIYARTERRDLKLRESIITNSTG